MPEGDTIHRAAARLDDAIGRARIEAVSGSHRAIRREGRRLIGTTILGVEAMGKHLLVHTDRAWTIRTHLGMTGQWHVYSTGERWRMTPGKARVVLETADRVAVCFAAPTVEVAPTDRVLTGLARLGPDLIDPGADMAAIAVRAQQSPAPTVADLLLDQEVAAGIGNVFKSEILYLEGIAPSTATTALDAAVLRRVYARAARLLRTNVGGTERTTTGRAGTERLWVYGRAGQPCRRCSTVIASDTHGPLQRVTYWCPSCQPNSRSTANG